jgi:hypothetical protein
MNKANIFIVFLTCLVACTTTQIKSIEAADNFKLSDYKTFNFYEVISSGDTTNQQYNHRIDILKNAIQQQLTAKGLSFTPDNPDLLVNIGVVTAEKVQTRQTNFREEAPRYMGQRRYSWKSQEVEVGRYKQGTVTVDLVDREQNALVWKGVAQAIVPKKESKLKETVQEGVGKLFSSL